jgi:hypothetical protein
MWYAVAYFMRGQARQVKEFYTFEDAKDFMKELAVSDDCESFKLIKARYQISLAR